MRFRIIIAAAALLVLAGVPARAADAPVVVELFTSQGCSSCPPADKLLGELAERPDVLALAYHVDYWDRLGWKDPFSSREATERQERYRRLLGLDTVYTPQIVVDGHWQAVGSEAGAVEAAIRDAGHSGATVRVALAVADGRAQVTVGPGAGAVVLVGFDRRHTTRVRRGENAGRLATDVDVVGGFAEIGRLDGKETRLAAPLPCACDRVAALVEAPDGHIIGAAVGDAGREE
jgi:hypothetical protein